MEWLAWMWRQIYGDLTVAGGLKDGGSRTEIKLDLGLVDNLLAGRASKKMKCCGHNVERLT